jgi:hypothetical protein
MIIQNNFSLNLDAQTAIDMIMEPVIQDPSIAESFMIFPKLYAGEVKLGLIKQMEKIVTTATACAPTYKGSLDITERTITPKKLQFGVKVCYDEFQYTQYDSLASIKAQGGKTYSDEFTNLLTGQLKTALSLDIDRLAWWGNVTSPDADYSLVNGVWSYIPNLVATSQIGQYVNTGSGGAITATAAYNFLQDVVLNAPAVLRQFAPSEKRIHIAGAMWIKILRYLQDNAISNGFINVFNQPLPGNIAATFMGIPVVVQDRWDTILGADFGLVEQHRILYTVKNNLVVGTDLRMNAAGSQAFVKVFEDPNTDELKMRGNFAFDTNYALPQLISVGY